MFRVAAIVLVLATAGCLAPAAAPEAETSAPAADGYAPNLYLLDSVRAVDARVSGGAEPSVLVDPSTGYVLIGDTAGIHRSTDNGATWTHVNPFFQFLLGDGAALARDDAGKLYATSLDGADILLTTSTDGGATWRSPTPVVSSGIATPVDVWPVADRPWIAAQGNGEVAIVYNQVGSPSATKCLRSTDGGQTFTEHRPSRGAAIAGGLAMDEDRNLYMIVNGVLDRYTKNCLGLDTSAPSTAWLQNRRTIDMFPGADGATNQMNVDVEGTDAYATMAGANNAVLRVASVHGDMLTRKEIVIAPPELKSYVFPVVSVHAGEVAVSWYGSETPGDPSDPSFAGSWNVFVARIDGFWTATPTVTIDRLTAVPNHVGDLCMAGIGCTGGGADRDLLDYYGIDHGADGSVHVSYGHDGSGSSAEVRHARLAP